MTWELLIVNRKTQFTSMFNWRNETVPQLRKYSFIVTFYSWIAWTSVKWWIVTLFMKPGYSCINFVQQVMQLNKYVTEIRHFYNVCCNTSVWMWECNTKVRKMQSDFQDSRKTVHNAMTKLYCERRSIRYILNITKESTDKCGCNMWREQKIIEFICMSRFQPRKNRGVGRPQITGSQNR
jgi:hypothetical protein